MSAALLLILLSTPCRAQPDQPFAAALDAVRISTGDLAVRADRWPTPMTLRAVEDALRAPASHPGKAVSEGGATLSAMADEAAGLLEVKPSTFQAAPLPPALPAGLRPVAEPVGRLLAAISAARADMARAVASLSPPERARALELVRAWVTNGNPEPTPADIRVLERFDVGAVVSAARRVLDELEPAAAGIAAPKEDGYAWPRRTRVPMEGGDLLIGGFGDDEYSAKDLEGVALLVDLGGRSTYLCAPAAAGEGEVRVVLDLSSEVVVGSSSGTASGTFGVGVLALPRARAGVVLRGGDVSLGAGLFGAGAVLLNGEAKVVGGRFSQGAGAFGMGLFRSRGDTSSFQVRMAGQGFGFTRGVGIFSHAGAGAHLDGGLVEPDPREPLAALSMSQGFGYGPRAWMAGGIGIARVRGDGCTLDASYMAQGAGYWHSLGLLTVEGDRCRVQGRRYVQGAGVHTAAGTFILRGSNNRSIVWGAGPALGWDYGVGILDVEGSSNSCQGEWATMKGDVNGHSLSLIQGNGNRLELPDAAGGALKRGAPSYGLLAVHGERNTYAAGSSTSFAGPLALAADPWSASVGGLVLAAPAEPKPEWPAVQRGTAFVAERDRLEELLRRAEALPPAGRAALWLQAASSSGLDGETGMAAAAKLAALPAEARSELVRLVSAGNFDANLWLSTLVPAFGRVLSRTILLELAKAEPVRRLALAPLLRGLPVEEALGPAVDLATAEDWRLRRGAAGTIGSLLARRRGQEPGRLRLLEAARAYVLKPSAFPAGSKAEEEWLRSLGEQRLGDLYAALALGEGMTADERVALLRAAPSPFSALPPSTLKAFAAVLSARPAAYASALSAELAESAAQEPQARKVLARLLDDQEPEVVQAALVALSALGRREDAPLIARFLVHPSAYLRESAAAGLGRMGAEGEGELRKALGAPEARTRALAAAGVSQTTEKKVLPLLGKALGDRDASVRRTALAGLLALPSPLIAERVRFKKQLDRLALSDPDPSVRFAAERTRRGL
ncbi:MAG: HEAT repeat domain-containing protein [Elusimicrobiota bacterium]